MDLDKLIDSSGVYLVVRQVGLGVLGGGHELHGCVEKAGDPHGGNYLELSQRRRDRDDISSICMCPVVRRVFSVWIFCFIYVYSINSKLYSLVHFGPRYKIYTRYKGTYMLYIVYTIVLYEVLLLLYL